MEGDRVRHTDSEAHIRAPGDVSRRLAGKAEFRSSTAEPVGCLITQEPQEVKIKGMRLDEVHGATVRKRTILGNIYCA